MDYRQMTRGEVALMLPSLRGTNFEELVRSYCPHDVALGEVYECVTRLRYESESCYACWNRSVPEGALKLLEGFELVD